MHKEETIMYENGKKVYFKDEKFNTHFGTIEGIVSEDSVIVTLRVKSEYDGNTHIVKKVKMKNHEAFYKEHGHY